jgi:hypothetical protein
MILRAVLLLAFVPGFLFAQAAQEASCDRGSRRVLENCPDGPHTVHSSGSSRVKKPDNWDWLVRNWTACYRGSAWRVQPGLYSSASGESYSGEVCITLKVKEVLFGPPQEFVPIWFTGVNFPGCITYDLGSRFEQYGQIGVGEELVVFCGNDKGDSCWFSSKWGVFFDGGNLPLSLTHREIRNLRRAISKGGKGNSKR